MKPENNKVDELEKILSKVVIPDSMIPIKQIRCHIGVQCDNIVSTSVDTERHECKMDLMQVGVLITSRNGKRVLVPFPNITQAELLE